MSQKKCTCPSYEGLTYDQIIEVSGLAKSKDQSRNCCEVGGYICPTLDKALLKAREIRDRNKKSRKNYTSTPSSGRNRTLTKKQLKLT